MLKIKSVFVVILSLSVLYPGIVRACDSPDESISGKKVVKHLESKHLKNEKDHKAANQKKVKPTNNSKSGIENSEKKISKKPNWFSRVFTNLYGTYVDGLRTIGRFLTSL